MNESLHRFTLQVLVVLALVALALLLWRLAGVLLLVFGAGLVAIALHALADAVRARLGWGFRAGLAVAVLLVAAVLAGAVWLVGREVSSQFGEVLARLPQGLESLRGWVRSHGWGSWVPAGLESAQAALQAVASRLPQAALVVSAGLVNLVLVVFGGIYLAANPAAYRNGFLKLFPPGARARVGGVADAGVRALRLWLRAQLFTMAIVALLTTAGLWVAGVPAPLALGLIAGLAEFIPYLGPIAAAIPGILLALTVGPDVALYAVLVYLAVQQLEGNVILPLVTRDVLELPPAFLVFSVVAFGIVFGTLGWIFAAPLTVLAVVVVGRLYVEETLGAPVRLPGERAGEPPQGHAGAVRQGKPGG